MDIILCIILCVITFIAIMIIFIGKDILKELKTINENSGTTVWLLESIHENLRNR